LLKIRELIVAGFFADFTPKKSKELSSLSLKINPELSELCLEKLPSSTPKSSARLK
jgi:hypothetical protein